MAQLDPDRYRRLSVPYGYASSDGLYQDTESPSLVLVLGGVIVDVITVAGHTGDLEVTSEARGDLLRRGAAAWERFSAKTSAQILIGDGTDVVSVAVSGDATISAAGALTVADVTVGADATGDVQYKSSATALTRLGIGSPGQVLRVNSAGTAPSWSDDVTSLDFTQQREVALFAKTTGAIKTAANAQQDFFRVGNPPQYFELAQGVGALGANTLLAANGLTPSTSGWLLTLDNTATDSLEITQGIVLGSAKAFTVGTSAAFTLKCAFLVSTRANITHLSTGFRVLGAYATAATYVEMKTAYADKAMIGIADNAGTLATDTSLANVDVSTALTHAAAVNGDILAVQVLVSAAGVTTYKLATTTPAGATAAQMQAAVTAAYAALAADASAVAYTFANATVVVPSIILGASGASAPDVKLVNYFCGLQ